MERRDFIKLASLAGFGVASTGLPDGFMREAWGASPRVYVILQALGGWDPTLLCDPKGGDVEEGTGINPDFAPEDIQQAGNINYAPTGNNAAFFNRFADNLLVINGIDQQTNGHDTGQRNSAAGNIKDGFPAFAALAAAALGEGQAMPFITNGGYDQTAGVVGATRFGNLNVIENLIHPNRVTPSNEESELHFTEETWDVIHEARQARLERMRATQRMPRIRKSQDLLYTSRLGSSGLKKLLEFLPDDLGNGLTRQANLGLAAYKAGITTSFNMAAGGFDTHSNHSANHIPRMSTQLDGATYLMDRAEELGIADEVVLVMCSDFGRTPNINDGNGKDHWAVGTMMLMGPGIEGNRVVGATDEGQNYRLVDPSTLEPTDGSNGVALRPAHVHMALRDHAGISDGIPTPFQLEVETALPGLLG